jgi:hypothetical protein
MLGFLPGCVARICLRVILRRHAPEEMADSCGLIGSDLVVGCELLRQQGRIMPGQGHLAT